MRYHHAHPGRARHARRTPDPQTAEQARRMIKACEHPCPDPERCGADVIRNAYINELSDHLADIDRAVIARVLLAAVAAVKGGTVYLRATMPPGPNDELAPALLGDAAGRMYLDTFPPDDPNRGPST